MSTTISDLEWVIGIGSLTAVIIGISLSILTLLSYKETKKPMLLYSGILFFLLPFPWLAQSSLFIMALLDVKQMNYTLYLVIAIGAFPLFSTLWMFITASLYTDRPKLKFYISTIYGLLGIGMYIDVFVIGGQYQEENNSIFINTVFNTYTRLLLVFCIISVIVFVGGSYIYFSIKSTSALFKIRSTLIGVGSICFAFAGMIDGVVEHVTIPIMIFGRSLITISFILLYLGYKTPNFIRQKYES